MRGWRVPRLPVILIGQKIVKRTRRLAIQGQIDASPVVALRKQCPEQPLAVAPENATAVTRNIEEKNDPRRGLQFLARHRGARIEFAFPLPCRFRAEMMNRLQVPVHQDRLATKPSGRVAPSA